MKRFQIQWTRRRLAGVAAAVTGVTVAGLLAVGSAVANSGTAPSTIGSSVRSALGIHRDHAFGRGGPGMRGIGGDHAAIVAKALGIDEATLRSELQSGKSIAALAKEKNVETAVIVNALLEPRKSDLAQRVTDSKMTQAQADAILGGEKARIELMLEGVLPMGGMSGRMGKGGLGGPEMMTAAAAALGVDEATLRTELRSGKSLAAVAKAKNVDVAKVIAAVVEERKADIAQHVKDGDLTQAQADKMLTDLEARVTEMVNSPLPMGGSGRGGRGGHGDHEGRGGRSGHGGRGGRGGHGFFGFGPGAEKQPTPTPASTSGQGG
jgi:hypothetical protein